MHTVGENTVHITDIGYETCKAGYSGVELPSIYKRREGQNYDDCLAQVLNEITTEPADVSLINIDDPFIHTEQRRKTFSHLMESSLCSGVLFINGAVADCFSYGKSAGLMIRLNGSSTQVIPMIEGYCLSGGLRSSCGGHFLTEVTRKCLQRKSDELKTNLLLPQAAIQAKERVALEQLPTYTEKAYYTGLSENQKYGQEMNVARCFKESVSFLGHCQPKYYEFATGFTTRIFSERNEIPEKLFKSENYTLERLDPTKQMSGTVGSMGLLEMVKTVMESVDLEYYDMLLGNVMLSGGGSLVPGITERLQSELMKMFPNTRVKVCNDRREFATFFGGSILGSLGAASTLMITKSDYSECGLSALDRKRSEWVR
ncbi:actin-like protein 6B [Nematocida homosporus]|uniref:actin-like protein 6B n=1 Tax=Nematocida homosporus TaxID=1912981 RepID=UPI00221FB296|nr:actin-like protein 6B [Nematocida homosporus]KAI5188086.1 actin-like protein 6B [Nematocida homosporus]